MGEIIHYLMPDGSTRSIQSTDTAAFNKAAEDARKMKEKAVKAEEKRRAAAEKKEAKRRQRVEASYARGVKKYGEDNLLANVFNRKG